MIRLPVDAPDAVAESDDEPIVTICPAMITNG